MAKQSSKTAKPSSGLEVAGEVVKIPLSMIVADQKWNSRSGDPTLGDNGPEEEPEFRELVESFLAKGQQTPVLVTPRKDGKYQLRVGFRRYLAAQAVAKRTEDKTGGQLLALVGQDMSEGDASLQNLAENVERADVSAADKAWGLSRTKTLMKKEGRYESDSALARTVGLKQHYVSRLLMVAERLSPDIFDDWRASRSPLSFNEVYEIAKLDTGKQKEAYQAATKGREGSGTGDGKGSTKVQKAPHVRAKKQAEQHAILLGILTRMGFVPTLSFLDVKNGPIMWMTKFDPSSSDITTKQWKDIAVAAEKAYQTALKGDLVAKTMKDDEDDDSDDDDGE